jgi:hypothetical protein
MTSPKKATKKKAPRKNGKAQWVRSLKKGGGTRRGRRSA